MTRWYRQLAVFLLSLCCLTAQSVSVVAAPCNMNEQGDSSAVTEHAESMATMDEHAHHAMMQAETAAAPDCCTDQENCSMTFCYVAAAMLHSAFSADNLEATTSHSGVPTSNVLSAHSSFFKPPISL